jgi:DNA polymerase I-like protein with 3'-5' exonuclease and polymerase domains/uracil-DNA glycosylase
MAQQGFFDLGDGHDPTIERTSSKKAGCASCPLKDSCGQEARFQGEGSKKILIITEYPNGGEDFFSRKEEKFLQDILSEIELDLYGDCWVTGAIQEEPTTMGQLDRVVANCRVKLLETVHKLKPAVIITLGITSLKGLIKHRIEGRLSKVKMSSFFGEAIPDQSLESWIFPTYSIQYLFSRRIRTGDGDEIDPVTKRFFSRSIKTACNKSRDGFYVHNYESDILTTLDVKEATGWLNKARKNTAIAFDYETTGLKPHKDGHSIETVSFSDGLFGYAFPFFGEDPDFVQAFKRLMLSKKVGKIAHKLDFENGWTRFRAIDAYVQNWEWDTCLMAHCINSNKPTGEKFWVYCYLGILGMDSKVDKYLKASKKAEDIDGANAFNNIKKADLQELLKYNAQDSLFCFKIYQIQKTLLTGRFQKGALFFMEGQEVLSHIQNEGMRTDVKKMEKSHKLLTRKIDRLYSELQASKEWKMWKERTPFNPTSEPQVSKMLYNILGYEKPEDGQKLTDKTQLKRIGTPFTNLILEYRACLKLRDTYLAQFKREEVDGVIRPFFNLHIPVTFRSSSNAVNFQNIPKRDPQSLKYVRSVIIPRDGNKLIEYDYKGVEVTVSGCVHQDPNMIKYIKDSRNDMHRDTAGDLFLRAPSEVSKAERQIGKNGYVFPSFYGSGPPNIAKSIWEVLPEETILHLKANGIKNFKQFYGHLEEVHKIFWNERFPVYRDWKRKIWKDYLKKGYVDLATGFRYYGPADFTQITNAPIQGPAFHLLLWSLTKIQPIVKHRFERSKIIGQIHDAAVLDAHPEDEPSIDKLFKVWGTVKVRERFPWVILPLSLEKESAEVNRPWNEMEGRGFI